MMSSPVPVFDGHNDILLRLATRFPVGAEVDFVTGLTGGHLDLPRMRKGGFVGGFFAIFIPPVEGFDGGDNLMKGTSYDVPLPALMSDRDALPMAMKQAGTLLRMEAASAGAFRVCRSMADIRAARAADAVVAVMHMEGAEAINRDLYGLDVLYRAGLRSLGPVWSRPTIFGHGVPFRFPSSPDTGPGLTETGERLIRACNDYRMVIDLSHINEQGFWDVARLSHLPLVATHSNAHVLCPHARNLTDRQLHAIRDSGGMVGLNFATCFLRPDGQLKADTPLSDMLDHLDHLIGEAGIDHVGLGSDFDGAMIPAAIGDVAGLPVLIEAMRGRGHDEATIAKLACDNWLALLERTWGE